LIKNSDDDDDAIIIKIIIKIKIIIITIIIIIIIQISDWEQFLSNCEQNNSGFLKGIFSQSLNANRLPRTENILPFQPSKQIPFFQYYPFFAYNRFKFLLIIKGLPKVLPRDY
jgi:hypothetical protein